MAAGSKSSRRSPLEGLARLISAITAGSPAAIFARRAAAKPRIGGAARALDSRAAGGSMAFAADISARFAWRMRSRMLKA
jgi:hypothetical protein